MVRNPEVQNFYCEIARNYDLHSRFDLVSNFYYRLKILKLDFTVSRIEKATYLSDVYVFQINTCPSVIYDLMDDFKIAFTDFSGRIIVNPTKGGNVGINNGASVRESIDKLLDNAIEKGIEVKEIELSIQEYDQFTNELKSLSVPEIVEQNVTINKYRGVLIKKVIE